MKPNSNSNGHTFDPSRIRRVLIIQSQMKQYRVPFFCRLYEALQGDGVHLTVAYSDPVAAELCKADSAELPGNVGLKVPGYWLARGRFLYQPLFRRILNSDLIIVEQANKHVLNWPLMAASRLGAKKIAFWGHGRNRQQSAGTLAQRLKKFTLHSADWWFAYTDGVAEYVSGAGFPSGKITTVRNSIDLGEFRRLIAEVDAHDSAELRDSLHIPPHAFVALYCGGLYPEKRVTFLIDAAEQVHAAIPEFHLIIIGGGQEVTSVNAAADQHRWIHYVGPQFRQKKAQLFRMAQIFLMPAAVGLSILDSFAAELPILTTSVDNHGPEIDYLQDGLNGFIVKPDSRHYAQAIIHVLQTPEQLRRLRRGAQESARRYSIEAMVEHFRSGVVKALDHSC
jgi:glycosyltransferase involved in cell wall biosynthesis